MEAQITPPELLSGCSRSTSAAYLHLQASNLTVRARRGRVRVTTQTEEKTQNEGKKEGPASQCPGQIQPIHSPKIKNKRDKTESSKTLDVPENQLNSLRQLTTLAYLHSSQVVGFGVKQGLFKVLLFVWGSLLGDLQLLCRGAARQCTSGIALVWMGTEAAVLSRQLN